MKETIFYALEMMVPLGTRHGTLSLLCKNGILTGTLELFEKRGAIQAGVWTGQCITFAGTLETPLDALPYQARGTIDGERICLCLQTERGCFEAAGHRISSAEMGSPDDT